MLSILIAGVYLFIAWDSLLPISYVRYRLNHFTNIFLKEQMREISLEEQAFLHDLITILVADNIVMTLNSVETGETVIYYPSLNERKAFFMALARLVIKEDWTEHVIEIGPYSMTSLNLNAASTIKISIVDSKKNNLIELLIKSGFYKNRINVSHVVSNNKICKNGTYYSKELYDILLEIAKNNIPNIEKKHWETPYHSDKENILF